jgi:transposase
LDTAKQVFRMHGVDENGKSRLRKQLAPAKVLEFFAQLTTCLAHGTEYRPAGPEVVAA